MGTPERQAAEPVARVEAALEEIEGLPDPRARDAALGAVQSLLELYGEGLAHVLERLDPASVDAVVGDDLVAHLLLVHGLHPVPVEERVARGLDEVRPYLESHGGGVELLEVAGGVARLRLEGTCDGCPSSGVTLKLAVEEAVHRAAPEIERVEADGGAPAPVMPALDSLPMVQVGSPPASNGNGLGGGPVPGPADGQFWATLRGVSVADGTTTVDDVLGRSVLFANVGGTLFAYRPSCPSCAGSLEGAALSGDELTCAGCGTRYDVRHAGRRLDGASSGLDPLPLLVGDEGAVKVAVATVGA